jgi:hypothetical protein
MGRIFLDLLERNENIVRVCLPLWIIAVFIVQKANEVPKVRDHIVGEIELVAKMWPDRPNVEIRPQEREK